MYRNLCNMIRNPKILRSKVFQTIFIGLFVGGLFFDIGTREYTNRQVFTTLIGFLFFSTINALFGTLM